MARWNTTLPMSFALAFAVSAGACTFDEEVERPPVFDSQLAEHAYNYEIVSPERPDQEELAGLYALSNKIDLTQGGLSRSEIAESVSALSDLAENPAKTLVDLLVAADSPTVKTVLDLIPDGFEEQAYDLMNEYVFNSVFQNNPGADFLTMAANDLETMVSDFEMITTLNLGHSDTYGNALLSHKFTGIAFEFSGKRFVVYAPVMLGENTMASNVDANTFHIVEDSPDLADAKVLIGDHSMSIPIGKLAMVGLDSAVQKTMHAASFRDALGQLFDCRGMAKAVADYCPGDVCASVEQPLADMCNAGLDEVVNSLSEELSNIRIDSVRFTGGEAGMYDMRYPNDTLDGRIDRIDDGRWDVSVSVRADDEPSVITGSFSGFRIGDYQRPEAPNSGFDIKGTSTVLSNGVTEPRDPIFAPVFDATLDDGSDDVVGPGGVRAIDDPIEVQTLPGGYEAVDPSVADSNSSPDFNTVVIVTAADPEQYGFDTIVTDALGAPRAGGTVAAR